MALVVDELIPFFLSAAVLMISGKLGLYKRTDSAGFERQFIYYFLLKFIEENHPVFSWIILRTDQYVITYPVSSSHKCKKRINELKVGDMAG